MDRAISRCGTIGAGWALAWAFASVAVPPTIAFAGTSQRAPVTQQAEATQAATPQPTPPTPPAPTGVSKVPAAPDGFRWQRLQESIDCRFLLPRGWHFHKVEAENGSAYFLTREEAAAGTFSTGLTVNLLPSVPGRDPLELAAATLRDLAVPNTVLNRWDLDTGPFAGPGALIRLTQEDGEAVRVYLLSLANRRTGSVTVIRFESPEEDWDEAWKTGVVMLDHFVLDDEY